MVALRHSASTLLNGGAHAGGPRYRVVLSAGACQRFACVREIVERERGDLRRLCRTARHGTWQVELHLGGHRIDDVATALEAAGFDVDAVVVATSEQRRDFASPASRRASPLIHN